MMKFKNSHISNHPSRNRHVPVTQPSLHPPLDRPGPTCPCPCSHPCPAHSSHYFDWLYPVTPGNRF